MWQLLDQSNGKTKGYLRILRDGKRVADVFPYAPGIDSQWTITMAQFLVDLANGSDRSLSAEAIDQQIRDAEELTRE